MKEVEKEVIGEIEAFTKIRDIYKAGYVKKYFIPPGQIHMCGSWRLEPRPYVMSPGMIERIQRTPENQAEYENRLHRDAVLFSISAHGLSHSKTQSEKAKLPRGIIAEIKGKLVSEYPDYTAKELWPHLFAELDARELEPEENSNVPGGEWYTYDHNGKRKPVRFTTFANIKTNK